MQGILGGTFDPPHNAHLAMARAAYTQLGLEAVLVMPAGDPWQKADVGVTDASDRWAMTQLLASEDCRLVADDTEIIRSGASYTVDTLERLDDRCVLILGADAAVGVPTWHRADEIVDFADVAVAPRAGVTKEAVEAAVGIQVTWLDMDPVDLSSTLIRQLAGSGGDYSGMVPASVATYIEEQGLYIARGNGPVAPYHLRR